MTRVPSPTGLRPSPAIKGLPRPATVPVLWRRSSTSTPARAPNSPACPANRRFSDKPRRRSQPAGALRQRRRPASGHRRGSAQLVESAVADELNGGHPRGDRPSHAGRLTAHRMPYRHARRGLDRDVPLRKAPRQELRDRPPRSCTHATTMVVAGGRSTTCADVPAVDGQIRIAGTLPQNHNHWGSAADSDTITGVQWRARSPRPETWRPGGQCSPE